MVIKIVIVVRARRGDSGADFKAHPKVFIGFSIPGLARGGCRQHVTRGLLLPGLTTNWCAGIVSRLEHGAFLVLTCGGALLVETGRGINVIVA